MIALYLHLMICVTVNNIDKMKDIYKDVPKLIIPVQSDPQAHWCVNRLSFVYIYNLHTHQELMMGLNHNDLTSFKIVDLTSFLDEGTYVFKKKYLSEIKGWENFIDVEMAVWFRTNHKATYTIDNIVKRYYVDFKEYTNSNDFIPIMRHLETCRSIKDNVIEHISDIKPTEAFINYQKILTNLIEIEKSGIYVN